MASVAVVTKPAAAVRRSAVKICITGRLSCIGPEGRHDRSRSVLEGVPDEPRQGGLPGDVRAPVVVGGELRRDDRGTEGGYAVGGALRVVRAQLGQDGVEVEY